MKTSFSAIGRLALLPLFVCTVVLPGVADAWESLVCYQWTAFPNERYKLAIRSHSDLSTWDEESNFGHPHQVAMTVVGKHVGVCGFTTVRPVGGSLIATDPTTGARLGLETFATTGFPTTCRDVEMSCRASNPSAWPPPVWDCFSRNNFDVDHTPSQLVRVDEATDPRCSVFEAEDQDGIVKLLGAPERASGRPTP